MSSTVRGSLDQDVCNVFLENCDKATLAALVQTSRFFFKIAVKFLWTDVTGVRRLLRCFPDESFTVGESTVLVRL